MKNFGKGIAVLAAAVLCLTAVILPLTVCAKTEAPAESSRPLAEAETTAPCVTRDAYTAQECLTQDVSVTQDAALIETVNTTAPAEAEATAAQSEAAANGAEAAVFPLEEPAESAGQIEAAKTEAATPDAETVIITGEAEGEAIKGDIVAVTFSIDSAQGVCNFDGPFEYDTTVLRPTKVPGSKTAMIEAGTALEESMAYGAYLMASDVTGILRCSFMDLANCAPTGTLFTVYFEVLTEYTGIQTVSLRFNDIQVKTGQTSVKPETTVIPAYVSVIASMTAIYDIGLGTDNPTERVPMRDGRLDLDDLTYQAPVKEGKTFQYWYLTAMDPIANTFTVEACYSINDPTPETGYRVQLSSGTFVGGAFRGKTLATGLCYNETLVIRADKAPEGQVFDRWEYAQTGQIVSTDEQTTILVGGDMEFNAVYREAGTAPTVMQSGVALQTVIEKDGNITFVSELRIENGDEMLKFGIVYGPGTSTYEQLCDPEHNPSAARVVEGTQRSFTNQYSVTIRNVVSGKTRKAVAFVTVKDAGGNVSTCYSLIALSATSTGA